MATYPRERLALAHVPAWLHEDAVGASDRGREILQRTLAEYQTAGVPRGELIACDQEGRDGTRLGGCFKVYLGEPVKGQPGPWGMVFAPVRQPDGTPALLPLAFGLRHPDNLGSTKPSVYKAADPRLHRPA